MKVQIANPESANETFSSLAKQSPTLTASELLLGQLIDRWEYSSWNLDADPWLRITNHADIKIACELMEKYPELLAVVPSEFVESIADDRIGTLNESEISYCQDQAIIFVSKSGSKQDDALWRIASTVIDPSELIDHTLKPHQRELCGVIACNILD